MSGSVYGSVFKVSTWGESHGKALGAVIDGCPAGISLTEEDIQIDLNKRRPGNSPYATSRSEGDLVEILSGVFDGVTTGTPISLIVFNKDNRAADYSNIKNVFRPAHADFTYTKKYGIRDYRGGGRASGRETLGRVAAGAVAKKILSEVGIDVCAYTLSIGDVKINFSNFDKNEIWNNHFVMPDSGAALKASKLMDMLIDSKDSCGGVIECVVSNIPAGIGDPVFNKLDAEISKAVLSIGAIKGVEFGLGFKSAKTYGSVNNDLFFTENGVINKKSNNSGGISGGISEGFDIIFRCAVKPTPSIAQEQMTVNDKGENIPVCIKGRHDPVIVPRAVVVIEAMTSLAIVNLLFTSMFSQMYFIKRHYNSTIRK